MRTRVLAFLGVLVLWAVVSHGNRWLDVMPPALLPTEALTDPASFLRRSMRSRPVIRRDS